MSENISADENLGRVVRVRWTDSGLHQSFGWAKRGEFFDHDLAALGVETVGLWVGENENVVCVAQSRDEKNDNWMSVMAIWKPSVQVVEWIEVSK